MKNAQAKWVNGIDSIRFFLALIVLLSHMHNPYVDILKESGVGVLKVLGIVINPAFSGISAVIAFFIISGFVIHYPNLKGPFDVKKFLIRRWLRIGLPLIVVAWVADWQGQFFMLPIWSLYCELIYYTIYPLLRKIKMAWKTMFIITFILSYVVIGIMAPGAYTSLFRQQEIDFMGQYWHLGVPLTWLIGLPCWLLGVILAEQFDEIKTGPSVSRIWQIRIFIFACAALTNVLRFNFFTSWLISENLFALLLFFWLKNELAYYKFRPSVRFFEYLGKFSYSLYLCHGLLLFAIEQYIPLNGYTYPLYLALIISFSYVVYLLVEYPSHKLAQRITKKRVKPAAVPVADK